MNMSGSVLQPITTFLMSVVQLMGSNQSAPTTAEIQAALTPELVSQILAKRTQIATTVFNLHSALGKMPFPIEKFFQSNLGSTEIKVENKNHVNSYQFASDELGSVKVLVEFPNVVAAEELDSQAIKSMTFLQLDNAGKILTTTALKSGAPEWHQAIQFFDNHLKSVLAQV